MEPVTVPQPRDKLPRHIFAVPVPQPGDKGPRLCSHLVLTARAQSNGGKIRNKVPKTNQGCSQNILGSETEHRTTLVRVQGSLASQSAFRAQRGIPAGHTPFPAGPARVKLPAHSTALAFLFSACSTKILLPQQHCQGCLEHAGTETMAHASSLLPVGNAGAISEQQHRIMCTSRVKVCVSKY